jgi:hypothetical protein
LVLVSGWTLKFFGKGEKRPVGEVVTAISGE